MLSQIREKREERARLHEEATKLIPKAGEKWTPENREKFNKLHEEIKRLGEEVRALEQHEELETELRDTRRPPESNPGSQQETREVRVVRDDKSRDRVAERRELMRRDFRSLCEEDKHRRAFLNYVAFGINEMEDEERKYLQGQRTTLKAGEARDMGIGTGSLGGYFVPQGFVYDIMESMKFYGKTIDESNLLDTPTGNPMYYPTDNDTANAATVIGEATQVSEEDVTIGHVLLNAWMFSTNMVKISLQLAQDSAFDVEAYVRKKFAIRLGRGLNTYLTNGTGTNQPDGFLTAIVAANGAAAAWPAAYGTPIIATGSSTNTGGTETGTTSIGTQDLEALIHSIDPAYRDGAKFCMHDQTELKLKQLLDKYGRPLWVPGVSADEPDRICGKPYFINNDMPTIAASANTLVFGNFKEYYLVRRVKELAIMRLTERFADYGQIALLGWARFDGQSLDPGNHPINYLQQHS